MGGEQALAETLQTAQSVFKVMGEGMGTAMAAWEAKCGKEKGKEKGKES